MKATEEEIEHFISNSDLIRGSIIRKTILLERSMDSFIACHFSPTGEKVWELLDILISERMDFSEKAAAFVQLLKKECNNQKTFEKNYPKINANFQDIAKARNDFAHKLSLNPRKEDLRKYVIILREFKNKKNDIYYSKEEIETILLRISTYTEMIRKRNEDKW